jgi:hypothetical protein
VGGQLEKDKNVLGLDAVGGFHKLIIMHNIAYCKLRYEINATQKKISGGRK